MEASFSCFVWVTGDDRSYRGWPTHSYMRNLPLLLLAHLGGPALSVSSESLSVWPAPRSATTGMAAVTVDSAFTFRLDTQRHTVHDGALANFAPRTPTGHHPMRTCSPSSTRSLDLARSISLDRARSRFRCQPVNPSDCAHLAAICCATTLTTLAAHLVDITMASRPCDARTRHPNVDRSVCPVPGAHAAAPCRHHAHGPADRARRLGRRSLGSAAAGTRT